MTSLVPPFTGPFSTPFRGPFDFGAVTGFVAVQAWIDWQTPTILKIRLSQEAAAGDMNAGVVITSNRLGNQLPVSGVLQADRRYIHYTLPAAVIEDDIITWIYSVPAGVIVNDNAEPLEANDPTGLIATNFVDDTAPMLVSATVPASGNVMDLLFDEGVLSPVLGMFVGWTANGEIEDDILFDSATGGNSQWSLHLLKQIKEGETVTIRYAAVTGDVRDLQDNDLADVTPPVPVQNNSTQSIIPNVPPELIGAVVDESTPNQIDLTFSEEVVDDSGTGAGWSATISGQGAVTVTGFTGGMEKTFAYIQRNCRLWGYCPG